MATLYVQPVILYTYFNAFSTLCGRNLFKIRKKAFCKAGLLNRKTLNLKKKPREKREWNGRVKSILSIIIDIIILGIIKCAKSWTFWEKALVLIKLGKYPFYDTFLEFQFIVNPTKITALREIIVCLYYARDY